MFGHPVMHDPIRNRTAGARTAAGRPPHATGGGRGRGRIARGVRRGGPRVSREAHDTAGEALEPQRRCRPGVPYGRGRIADPSAAANREPGTDAVPSGAAGNDHQLAARGHVGRVMTAVYEFPALGTTAAVAVTDPAALERAVIAVETELAAVDAACSRFRPDSELMTIDREVPVQASPLLAGALAIALRASDETGGLVDPIAGCSDDGRPRVSVDPLTGTVRIPARVTVDLGATGKAMAADRCAARAGGSRRLWGAGQPGRRSRGRRTGTPRGLGGGYRRLAPGRDPRPDRRRQARRARHLERHHTLGRRRRTSHFRSAHRPAGERRVAHRQRGGVHMRGGQHADHGGDRRRRLGREPVEAPGVPARLVAADGRVTTLGGWPQRRTAA